MKKIIIVLVVVVAVALLVAAWSQMSSESRDSQQTETFVGIYEAYDTGCFADGVCSATVSGSEVITIIGWSQDASGTFADPDIPFGTEVEVYAQKLGSNSYTLYGSEDFYIKEL